MQVWNYDIFILHNFSYLYFSMISRYILRRIKSWIPSLPSFSNISPSPPDNNKGRRRRRRKRSREGEEVEEEERGKGKEGGWEDGVRCLASCANLWYTTSCFVLT